MFTIALNEFLGSFYFTSSPSVFKRHPLETVRGKGLMRKKPERQTQFSN